MLLILQEYFITFDLHTEWKHAMDYITFANAS